MRRPLVIMIGIAGAFATVGVGSLALSLALPPHAVQTPQVRASAPVAVTPVSNVTSTPAPAAPPPVEMVATSRPARIAKVVQASGDAAIEKDHRHLYALALSVDPSCASDDGITLSSACFRTALTEEARRREIAEGMAPEVATGNDVQDRDSVIIKKFYDDSMAAR